METVHIDYSSIEPMILEMLEFKSNQLEIIEILSANMPVIVLVQFFIIGILVILAFGLGVNKNV